MLNGHTHKVGCVCVCVKKLKVVLTKEPPYTVSLTHTQPSLSPPSLPPLPLRSSHHHTPSTGHSSSSLNPNYPSIRHFYLHSNRATSSLPHLAAQWRESFCFQVIRHSWGDFFSWFYSWYCCHSSVSMETVCTLLMEWFGWCSG